MAITEPAIMGALQRVVDPNTGKDFVSSKCIKDLRIQGSSVHLTLELGYPAQSQVSAFVSALQEAARSVDGVTEVLVTPRLNVAAHAVQRGVQLLPGVKNIVGVASGKGGVGKSTTAVNLALALAAEGARVGLLDADIYGPSLPMMMGIEGRPVSEDGKTMEPMENHGVQVNSIGFLVDQDEAMIWRGPMATQALEQLLRQTHWKDLDYLIVDMPPGTGDIQLTLSQRVPMTGAVVVTTPQDIALLDARKGIKMFEKVGVPVLGIVENMAVHICRQCGHAEHIFAPMVARKWRPITVWITWALCRWTCRSGFRPMVVGRAWWPSRRVKSPGCTKPWHAVWRWRLPPRTRTFPASSRRSPSARTPDFGVAVGVRQCGIGLASFLRT